MFRAFRLLLYGEWNPPGIPVSTWTRLSCSSLDLLNLLFGVYMVYSFILLLVGYPDLGHQVLWCVGASFIELDSPSNIDCLLPSLSRSLKVDIWTAIPTLILVLCLKYPRFQALAVVQVRKKSRNHPWSLWTTVKPDVNSIDGSNRSRTIVSTSVALRSMYKWPSRSFSYYLSQIWRCEFTYGDISNILYDISVQCRKICDYYHKDSVAWCKYVVLVYWITDILNWCHIVVCRFRRSFCIGYMFPFPHPIQNV